MIQAIDQRFELCTAPSWQAYQKIRQLVFNRFNGLEVSGLTADGRDTSFSYLVSVDLKKTKRRVKSAELATVKAYCLGVLDTLKSF